VVYSARGKGPLWEGSANTGLLAQISEAPKKPVAVPLNYDIRPEALRKKAAVVRDGVARAWYPSKRL
jgi:hypothetical protein